jgi:hypothetical protein
MEREWEESNARGAAEECYVSFHSLPLRLQLVYVFVPGLGRDAKWPAKLLLARSAIYSLRLCKDSELSDKRVLD